MILANDIDAETRDLIALNLVPGLGPRLTKALLERFGTASKALRAATEELRSLSHVGDQTARQLAEAFRMVDPQPEIDLLEKHDCRLMRLGGTDYPPLLAAIYDPPPLLYFIGDEAALAGRMIAIVGSRHCTNYGRRTAEKLAEGLVRAGLVVVSGLARGIDAHAHRGALNGGGRTIAVLAGGLARIYPPEHKELAEEITRSGALMSETPLNFAPMAGMFPARNRIISGMCKGVIVVEAAMKSGALITARHAAEQGRDVFAVPGQIDSEASAGTLKLLKDGATLVRHVDDVLQTLGDETPAAGPGGAAVETKPAAAVQLTERQQQLYDLLGTDALHADDLITRSGMPVSEVGGCLLLMEMQGAIRRLPGNRFERK